MKLNNPYRPGSLQWSLIEGEWADMTIEQISEALFCGVETTRSLMTKIKQKTGYTVQYKRQKRRTADELHGGWR